MPTEQLRLDAASLTRLSRLLSLVLRHDPGQIGLRLDDAGWAGVTDLLDALNRRPPNASKRHRTLPTVTRELIEEVVLKNDKRRFSLSEDRSRMHAAGHAFYLASNGTWLTTSVPPVYLRTL